MFSSFSIIIKMQNIVEAIQILNRRSEDDSAQFNAGGVGKAVESLGDGLTNE